jgi:tellurite resistance protein TehA-like permease
MAKAASIRSAWRTIEPRWLLPLVAVIVAISALVLVETQ